MLSASDGANCRHCMLSVVKTDGARGLMPFDCWASLESQAYLLLGVYSRRGWESERVRRFSGHDVELEPGRISGQDVNRTRETSSNDGANLA
jgi:hypothetical protein